MQNVWLQQQPPQEEPEQEPTTPWLELIPGEDGRPHYMQARHDGGAFIIVCLMPPANFFLA